MSTQSATQTFRTHMVATKKSFVEWGRERGVSVKEKSLNASNALKWAERMISEQSHFCSCETFDENILHFESECVTKDITVLNSHTSIKSFFSFILLFNPHNKHERYGFFTKCQSLFCEVVRQTNIMPERLFDRPTKRASACKQAKKQKINKWKDIKGN